MPCAVFTLPKSGSYVLHVEAESESDVPYTARLRIR
jgi:hypothetical protein